MRNTRSNWQFRLGSVVVLGLAFGAGLVARSAAEPAATGTASMFVPITPCRLFDTRPAPDNVGGRSSPLAAGEMHTVVGRGTVGRCTLPSTATGLGLNVAIVNPTAASFLTVFPSGAARPTTANLNWVAGQAPTPNAVNAALGADGQLSFYNLSGRVDLAVDVMGYYEPAAGAPGPTGPAGPVGPAGPAGANGPKGSARASASVSQSGEVLAGTNVVAATITSPGVFCVAIDPSVVVTANTPILVSLDFRRSQTSVFGDLHGIVEASPDELATCPTANSVTVRTFSQDTTGDVVATSQGFSLLIP